jgi:hypothetical protein
LHLDEFDRVGIDTRAEKYLAIAGNDIRHINECPIVARIEGIAASGKLRSVGLSTAVGVGGKGSRTDHPLRLVVQSVPVGVVSRVGRSGVRPITPLPGVRQPVSIGIGSGVKCKS